jgi:hypothetical protein
MVAISANDANTYPDDAPESLKEMAEAESFSFPYCYDETQAVATTYAAACTPDFSCLIGSVNWSIEGNWTRVGPARRFR